MPRLSSLWSALLLACGGATSPAPAPAAPVPAASASPSTAPATEAEPPDRAYQEALRCEEDCLTTEDGDYDEVEARCRDQCGLPPREP